MSDPIGQRVTVPSAGFDQGEHGAGTGLSGGHGVPGAHNTQSGIAAAEERAGFNHGVGGAHASGGLPQRLEGGVGSTLDEYSGQSGGLYGSSGQAPQGDAVSGAYEGGGTRDGLTGQSGAQTTGAGVGVLGSNLSSTPIADKYATTTAGTGHHHHHHGHHHHAAEGAALGAGAGVLYAAGSDKYGGDQSSAGGGGGYAAGSDQRTAAGGEYSSGGPPLGAPIGGAGAHHHSHGQQGLTHDREIGIDPSTASGPTTGFGNSDAYNVGAGPAGGAGGHYSTSGQSGLDQSGIGAGAGAAGLGAGAAVGGLAGAEYAKGRDQSDSGVSAPTDIGSGAGTQEAGEDDPRGVKPIPGPAGKEGAPISDPAELDTGGPHSLVFQESTGKYVHRRELEGQQ